MPPRFTAVLLDLDGTIVDSAPGILSTLVRTHRELGLPVPPRTELLRWVGPPLLESFRERAGLEEDAARRALALYRGHYAREGVLDVAPYPGVIDAIRAIRDAGLPLSLATSKLETTARGMLDRLGIAEHFTAITGASPDEAIRSTKAEVVAEALRRLADGGAELSRPVMVGDRIHDVEGAAVHAVPTISVGWGYGSPTEAAGAIATVATPGELLAALGL